MTRPTDRAAVSPTAEKTEAQRVPPPARTLWRDARGRKVRKHANVRVLVRARGCAQFLLGEVEVCTQTNIGCGPRSTRAASIEPCHHPVLDAQMMAGRARPSHEAVQYCQYIDKRVTHLENVLILRKLSSLPFAVIFCR